MKSFIFLFVFLGGCAAKGSLGSGVSEDKVYVDPSDGCSSVVYRPAKVSEASRVIVAQLGSDAFAFDMRVGPVVLDRISSRLLASDFLIEVDQPGVASSLNPVVRHPEYAWNIRKEFNGSHEIEVRRFRKSYLWDSQDFANCYLSAIKRFESLYGRREIILFGISMGGDIMPRVLEKIRTHPTAVRGRVAKVLLGAPLLEDAHSLFARQVRNLNEQSRGQTVTTTERWTDPESGRSMSQEIKEPVAPLNSKALWNSVIALKKSDYPEGNQMPSETRVEKLYLRGWDFSNFYLQGLNRLGAAGKILLKKGLAPQTKCIIYQGLSDWRVNPAYIQDLQRKLSSDPQFTFRFYKQDHNLMDNKIFLRDIAKDLTP